MRLIPISQYNDKTMKLAKPVYDSQRRILLAADHTIHPKFLDRLIQIGIRVLFVEDAESRGITLEEMMDLPTWIDLIHHVKEAYDAVGAKKPLSVRTLQNGAGRLIMEIQKRPVVVPVPVSTLAPDLKPYAHAVNVAILSLQVAKALGYNELMLRDLAVGCLLHDIGKVATKEKQQHPEAGFQILRNIRELSLLSAHVAFQHHEAFDGTGYPRGITGGHEYAQICGVCNYYENLVSSDELLPHEAMEAVMTRSGTLYAQKLVETFVRVIPSYPPGIKVKLHSGEEAIVAKIISHMQRPVIRKLLSGEELDLSDHPTMMIVGLQ